MNIIGSHSYQGKTVYKVELFKGEHISDNELITRCDNSTTDLTKDAGKIYHFGGKVKQQELKTNSEIFEVTVWID